MAPPRPPRARDRQRGNTLLIALIVMSALATLGSLTVVSVQSSLQTSTNDRAQAIAMYAAESGAAAAMDFLRKNFNSATGWSAYVTPSNSGFAMAAIPGNNVPPEDSTSLFTTEQHAWFHIQLLNNRDDPGYAGAFGSNDQDGRIIIRSTGHGPQDSHVIIEWEVRRLPECSAPPPSSPPPPPQPSPPPPPPCGLPPPAISPPASPPDPPDPPWGPVPSTQPLILLGWHVVTLQ